VKTSLLLANYFIERYAATPAKGFEASTNGLRTSRGIQLAGNIRELQNVISEP